MLVTDGNGGLMVGHRPLMREPQREPVQLPVCLLGLSSVADSRQGGHPAPHSQGAGPVWGGWGRGQGPQGSNGREEGSFHLEP